MKQLGVADTYPAFPSLKSISNPHSILDLNTTQTFLGDTADLILNYHNEASITITQV